MLTVPFFQRGSQHLPLRTVVKWLKPSARPGATLQGERQGSHKQAPGDWLRSFLCLLSDSGWERQRQLKKLPSQSLHGCLLPKLLVIMLPKTGTADDGEIIGAVLI